MAKATTIRDDPASYAYTGDNTVDIAYALITGASRGLGKAFAEALAGRRINLLLVALPDDGLPEVCAELEKRYAIRCGYFETDLTHRSGIDNLVEWALGNYRINILINNAGMGGSKEFEHAETEHLEAMIALNIRAMTLITHSLLPELKSHKNAWILNVASMASFSPIGYKTIYPASKVFVRYFTRGLSEELKGTGVSASVVSPGPMKTNIHVTERILRHGFFGKIGLLSPQYVAERSIRKMFRQKPHIIPGLFNYLSWLVQTFVPLRIRLPIITGKFRKEVMATNKKTAGAEGTKLHPKQ